LRHACAERGDLAGRFRADDERQLALGEGHAAEAPDVEVIESDRVHADLHLALRRRGGAGGLDEFELAVGDELECAHQAGSRPITSDTFWPPKPKELEIACVTRASRALCGTTSSVIAGSGTS